MPSADPIRTRRPRPALLARRPRAACRLASTALLPRFSRYLFSDP